jgi:flagellar biosynthesis/type III secretory pathway protein FliH
MTLAEHIERASRNTAETYEEGYNDGYEADKTDVYNQGYADGQKCHEETTEDIYRKGFENGLEQAWECARKIYNMTAKEVIAIFGGCSLWVDYSASEAIAKIKEYEQNQTDEMSMSDAINWMKDYFRTTDMPMPQYEKAFEMAIKSMEYIDDHAL